jgi:hypothetical protein
METVLGRGGYHIQRGCKDVKILVSFYFPGLFLVPSCNITSIEVILCLTPFLSNFPSFET